MGTTADKLARLNETKALLKTRLTEKGIDVASEDNFYNLADKVGEIQNGGKTEIYQFSGASEDSFSLSLPVDVTDKNFFLIPSIFNFDIATYAQDYFSKYSSSALAYPNFICNIKNINNGGATTLASMTFSQDIGVSFLDSSSDTYFIANEFAPASTFISGDTIDLTLYSSFLTGINAIFIPNMEYTLTVWD